MTKAICFLYLLAVAFFTHAQNSKSSAESQSAYFADANRLDKIKAAIPAIEKIYKEHAEKNHFPAFAFGLVVDGQLIYSGNVGYTDTDKKTQVSDKSVFRIASMSKSFTAMAIVKLRDEGRLNLDDPASKYIPQLKKVKYLATDAVPITVRNLLTHSAGFPEDNPWGDRQLSDTDKELMQLIENGVYLSTVPGVAYEYSNLAFALLGRIITNVSGKQYQQYITQNILKPLGMNDTYWEYTNVPAKQLAHGYRWINQQWREEELLHDGSYGAMGGLMTTIEDFSKYMTLHMSAWPPQSATESNVLKRSSLREMQQPWMFSGLNTQFRYPNGRSCATTSAYGYGLRWVTDCEGRRWVGHSGGLPGFGSEWRMLQDYGIGVVSFANLTYAGTGGVNLRVLDTIIALAQLKQRQVPASPILNQRKNELVKLLPNWNNAEKSGIFAENFFPDYPIDSLKKQASNIFANAGKIIRVKDMVAENNLRGRFVMEGEKKDIEIFFTLTPENPPLIQEYRIREIKK
ncbi:MAG TPA: serine hydrolase domain-containing protein [Segetibacter sp.]|jgi:CubicO group peptidase (beta-lactamase class C family)